MARVRLGQTVRPHNPSGKGGFKPGNPGGKGGAHNTMATRAAKRAKIDLIDAAVSDKDWEAIFKAQVARAKAGSTEAAKYLTEHRWGKPPQDVNHGGQEGNEVVLRVVPYVPKPVEPESPK